MEKIKIKKSELADIYDIEDDSKKPETKDDGRNFTYEEYTENYDKKELKEMVDDSSS